MSVRPPAITVALAVALAITAVWWQLAEHRARTAEARLEQAGRRIAALEDSARSPARREAPAARGSDEAILADLARHPELIPFPGTEGGTMRFYPSQSRLIAPGWAYGYFEDGHVAGRGLFEYRMAPGGNITWKRLAATLD